MLQIDSKAIEQSSEIGCLTTCLPIFQTGVSQRQPLGSASCF